MEEIRRFTFVTGSRVDTDQIRYASLKPHRAAGLT